MILLIILLLLFGCSPKIPEPETIKAEASEVEVNKKIDYHVRYIVEKGDVKFEWIIPTASFNDENGVKIRLFINGKFYNEYDRAAFIVKNLQPGHHQFRFDLVNNQTEVITRLQEISITIK